MHPEQSGFILLPKGGWKVDWTTIIAVIAAISGIALGWVGRSRTIRQDTVSEADKDATMRVDVEYIKRGVDDVRVEQRFQGQRFDVLTERITRVEESTKQAHLRINRLDGIKAQETN